MENRFLETNAQRILRKRGKGIASSQSMVWAQPFSARDRVLIILIENGGVDLGIPTLVGKILSSVPGSNLISDTYRQNLVNYIRDKIRSLTDSLLESVELSINRYSAAKPDLFGDVVILRDGTASYQDLKDKLTAFSRDGKIVDLFILTHGSGDYISVTGGISSQKIRDMIASYGKPLSIRSVYMMNCVGSSLNQAWIDAGAKVSSGSIGNNYLPEPTMFFFWKNWKEGQTFENAVTSAYRQTINLMNTALRTFVQQIPIPGSGLLSESLDFSNMDFVIESAPQIQGQRTVTINSDALTFSKSTSSSLATTVLPIGLLSRLCVSQSASNAQRQSRTISQQGIDFIKGWEGFRAKMYNDSGHCAIGYGTVLHTGNCDGSPTEQPYVNGISEENATQLLVQKAGEVQQIINDSMKVALNQNQHDSLVSFVYNVGTDNFQKSTLLLLLNQGNYAAVATEIKKWTKARQNGQLVDLLGLKRRRDAEAELFQKPSNVVTQQSNYSFAQTPAAVIPIATTILGATMTRVINNTGDISWELDQLNGLKHADNNPSTAGSATYQTKSITIDGPHAWLGGGLDHIYVDSEITFQYNGHSLGNVQVSIVRSNDAAGAGLVVKENIMDDANTYTQPPNTERFAAIKLRIHYRVTFTFGGDYIWIDDIVLYGNGTYDRRQRRTQ